MSGKNLIILSGGMDSTVAAYLAAGNSKELVCVSFDYGQKHWKELRFAKNTALRLGADWVIVSLKDLGHIFKSSALTNEEIAVPEGHYADEVMKATVVPNRNAIMASIAIGICVDRGFNTLWTGVHAGDHPVYPDCRPEFIDVLEVFAHIACEGFIEPDFKIVAPFLNSEKSEIVRTGLEYSVNFAQHTWSCYKGGDIHCGLCSTCLERKVAFLQADVVDGTIYTAGYSNPQFLKDAMPDLTFEVLSNGTSQYWGLQQQVKKLIEQ